MSDDEMRDIGPYENAAQAETQFNNWSRGMEGHLRKPDTVVMLLTESLLLAGVRLSDYERRVLYTRGIDPQLAQIISGWLLRAATTP